MICLHRIYWKWCLWTWHKSSRRWN